MKIFNQLLSFLGASSPLKEGVEPAVYFLGIGGIGMSALARYFQSQGVKVSGYDKTETVLTRQLSAEGIAIHYEDKIEWINKDAQLVIYTPAVPKDSIELNFYQQNNYTVVKRSEVLGAITNAAFNICIAGTHGKTTTSTMVGHILRHSKYGCNAFLGGISVNYGTNFWSDSKNVCVVEADEYDRSFLKLSPDIAIISSMDADHLDIYGTAENMEQAFIDFSKKVKPGGLLISKYGLNRAADLGADQMLTYHLTDNKANIFASNIIIQNGSYQFDIEWNDFNGGNWMLKGVVLNMGGKHNIENMLAAITVAHHIGVEDKKIIDAVADFKGVKRRFEYILKSSHQVFIDDYAHHPEELRALITGAKNLFPDKKCTVVFQPHLFSRTRDFVDGFAEVLDLADEIILLPIYPARELPIPGVTSDMLVERMRISKKQVMSKEALLAWAATTPDKLIVMAGAGDIDVCINNIKDLLISIK